MDTLLSGWTPGGRTRLVLSVRADFRSWRRLAAGPQPFTWQLPLWNTGSSQGKERSTRPPLATPSVSHPPTSTRHQSPAPRDSVNPTLFMLYQAVDQYIGFVARPGIDECCTPLQVTPESHLFTTESKFHYISPPIGTEQHRYNGASLTTVQSKLCTNSFIIINLSLVIG